MKTVGTEFIFVEKNNTQLFSNSLKALKVRRCFNQQKYCPEISYCESFTGSKSDEKYVNTVKSAT